MNKTCRLLSLLLALLLLTGAFASAPPTAYAAGEDEDPVLYSGGCGVDENSDVEYYYFKDGSMVIFGTGAICDYETQSGSLLGVSLTVSTAPWFGTDMSTISNTLNNTKIAVEYGVTRIGDYSFYLPDGYPVRYYLRLTNIDIANTVTSIGKYAFYNQIIQQITIPPSVTHIGENAFKGCSLRSADGIIYYGDPGNLIWDRDGAEDSEFPSGMTVHILDTYADKVADFNAAFAYKHITFVADQTNPYSAVDESIDRNITAYYGSTNSNVFGGAAPFIIVGRFDGKKKSVTYGSNGFASCVYDGTDYYILTDNATGRLNLATRNGTTDKVTGYTTVNDKLELHITHEYIGSNIVKMIYTLTNKSEQNLTDLKVGGTGDIKIGADDKAAIMPLTENNVQTGFYMTSSKNYDKDTQNNYATLGFIGKGVAVGGTPSDATFFYGKVDTNKNQSAAGAKTLVLMPERIFNKNTASESLSQETGSTSANIDTGMSYYWDVASLPAGQSAQYAVLFSVNGVQSSGDQSAAIIADTDENNFYNVTWKNWDGSTLLTQVVKKGETPVQPGFTPTRPRDAANRAGYTFTVWELTDSLTEGGTTYPIEYTAQYSENNLFKGHSLTLDGDIGVNFFVDVSTEQVQKGVTIKFNWNGLYQNRSEYTLTESDYCSENGLYKARCNVCAAEMTDDITATAYFENAAYTKETDSYSVKEYAWEIFTPAAGGPIAELAASDNAQYTKLVDLAEAMLDYGTKAQIAFNHNNSADKYANKDVSYTMNTVTSTMIDNAIKAANNNETKSSMTSGTGDFGLQYYGSSVVYLTKTSLRHYYTVTNQDTYDTQKSTLAGSFTEHTDKLPYIYFELEDIPAAQLDALQEFTIGGHTYKYSVLDYAKSLLGSGYDESANNLGKATYWYNYYANIYFGC